MSKIIDCKGMACPKPVIMTKKELDSVESGEVTTIVDNDAARQNLQKLGESLGCTSKVEDKDGLFHVTITKTSSQVITGGDKNLVVLITSDKFGSGDDTLGTALMKSYMYALSESDVTPSTIAFLNGGVKLTTEGSDVLESVRRLEEKGAEIISCGTCLDFYGLKEKLVVGKVSNMYTIVEKMNNASNTIRL